MINKIIFGHAAELQHEGADAVRRIDGREVLNRPNVAQIVNWAAPWRKGASLDFILVLGEFLETVRRGIDIS